MTKHVLVTYGSRRGGTAEIANAIADCLRQDGCTVNCKPAHEVETLAGYDAAIIGGALYMGRWQRDAQRFIARHAEHLRELPVWLFSSGPLDASAGDGDIPPTRQVAKLITRIGARGHITFGGRLAADATGFPAAAMAKQHAGDWRDWDHIRAWACNLAAQIQAETQLPAPAYAGPPRRRWPLIALCAFVAITATIGGATLVAEPMLLLVLLGCGNALAAVLLAGHRRMGMIAAFAAGTALVVWVVGEMILLRTAHWLQLGYFGIGIAIMLLAWRAARATERAAADRKRSVRIEAARA